MEGKLNNHIEFKFIRSQYPIYEKLFCYFQSSNISSWQPEVGDWVGLVKVGWNNLKECKIRKTIQNEWLESRKKVNVDYSHVVFELSELPTDYEGFYQFVYVTKNDLVRGVSKSFQFEQINLPQYAEQRRLAEGVKSEIEMPVHGRDTETLIARVESDLIRECQRLNLNWSKITDDAVNGKLLQKYLNNLKSMQKDEEITRRVEELFVENGKLCISIKSKIQEIADLRRDWEEMKSVNADLLNRLTIAERTIELYERDRLSWIKKFKELSQSKDSKQWVELDEKKWYECEQPELTRWTSLYELETSMEPKVTFVQRIEDMPMPKSWSWFDRVLPTVEGTSKEDVMLLNRVIEDLKKDNELLRERLRKGESESVKTEVHEQVKPRGVNIASELVNKQSLPTVTATVSLHETIKPIIQRIFESDREQIECEQRERELKQKQQGYIQQQHQPQQQQQQQHQPQQQQGYIQQQQQQQQLHTQQIRQQPIQQQSLPVQSQMHSIQQHSLPVQTQIHSVQQHSLPVQSQMHSIQQQAPIQMVHHEQQQQQQQQHLPQQSQQQVRSQFGEYLHKLDDELRCKIEERLRTRLQEQLKCKLDEMSSKMPLKPQQWSVHVTETELYPSSLPQKWRLDEQTRKQPLTTQKPLSTRVEQQQQQQQQQQMKSTTMCPVCGIVMPSELATADFEIHVNSHFTD